MLHAWIDTFPWDTFRANHSILLLLNAACMNRHVVPLGHIQSQPFYTLTNLHAWIDTLFHWDTFRANHSILLLLNAACYMNRHVVPLGHIQSQPFYTLTP